MAESIEAAEAVASLAEQTLSTNGKTELIPKQESSPKTVSHLNLRKERKGGSYVWNYCEKLSRHLILCNLCNKRMSFHGTANVITHLQRKHNIIGKIDGDRSTVDNTVPDLNIDDDNQLLEADKCNTRKYRRHSSSSSVVWKYCIRVGRDVVRCGFCKKNLSYQGTSNLQRHLHRMHGVVTQARGSKNGDHEYMHPWKRLDNSFIWQHCSTLEDCENRIKCNLCEAVYDAKDTEEIGNHLRELHGVQPVHTYSTRKRKRRRSITEDETSSYDDADFDNDWSKNDLSNDAAGFVDFKKDEALFNDIIEEDPEHAHYEEEPIDPNMVSEKSLANPLSPSSSREASPGFDSRYIVKSKKLQKLNEEKIRMETEYYREKAGFYRMQKYLAALQATRMRKELEQLNNISNGVVLLKSDAYANNTNLSNIGQMDSMNQLT